MLAQCSWTLVTGEGFAGTRAPSPYFIRPCGCHGLSGRPVQVGPRVWSRHSTVGMGLTMFRFCAIHVT